MANFLELETHLIAFKKKKNTDKPNIWEQKKFCETTEEVK